MSTKPLPPPEVVADDPGPWSVVSHVRQTLAHRPDRRRGPTPSGLLMASPPRAGLPLAGLEPGHRLAGAGPVRLTGAAREGALGLAVDGDLVIGVTPGVRRRWRLPDLRLEGEERPEEDPAAGLLAPVAVPDLGTADLSGAVLAPGGEIAAVPVAAGRVPALALLRVADRGLVRWILGARAGAWAPDGGTLVIGGDWGLILAVRAE
jgi:hypothetical protein